jgi:antitoxin PrlF
MKEITAAITQRGQVTIPVEVQRLLGIKPRGKVMFAIDGGQVRLMPPRFTLKTAFGSVEPINRPEDFEAMIQEAKGEHARWTVEKMRPE